MQFRSFAKVLLLAFAFTPALLPIMAHAQSAPAVAEPSAPASKMIQDLGNKAISAASDKNLSATQKKDTYKDLLRSSFDIPTIGHFVLGRYWSSTPPEKQQEFLKLFEQLIVKIYSEKINFYTGEGFHVKGERAEDERDTIVNSEITHPDASKATTVDWRIRTANGKMSVIDVSIEGVSQSVTQRQEYASILQQNGGNIDPLLQLMQQQMNGEAPAKAGQ